MSDNLCSVILPVYNCETFLRRSITSVLNQSYRNFEFIIINDGSTDKSEEIILSFNDERIKYIKNEVNLGLIKTLNLGIEISKGTYIVRIDADDECLPKRFEKQVSFMNENRRIAASGTYAYRILSDGTVTEWKFPTDHEQIKCRLFWGSGIIHPSAIIRKESLKQIKFNEKFKHAEDYKLWKDLSIIGELANIPEFYINYYEHEGQITNQKRDEMNQTCFNINLEWLSQLQIELPDNLIDCYKKFLQYNYNNWSATDLERLIIFLHSMKIQNEKLNIFSSSTFNLEIAEKLYFAVFNNLSKIPQGFSLYKKSSFSSIKPLKIKDYAKFLKSKLT